MKKIHSLLAGLVLVLAMSGCLPTIGGSDSKSFKKWQVNPTVVSGKAVQKATLTTKEQQLNAIRKALEFTAFDEYEHDDKQLENGHRKAGSSKADYWSTDKYAKIKRLREYIEAGGKNLAKDLGYEIVFTDCDDSGVMLYQTLVDMGYPRDQLYWNFYMVPPSQMAGISGKKYGGHFVLTIDVEGMRPVSIEDMFPDYRDVDPSRIKKDVWRYLYELEINRSYYCVGQHRMDTDIRGDWYFIDQGGYQDFVKGKLSFVKAISTKPYLMHRKYISTIYNRADYE